MANYESFKEYWSDLSKDGKAALARDAGTSVNLLSQVAHGHKVCGFSIAHRLNRARPDVLTLPMLKPDYFKVQA